MLLALRYSNLQWSVLGMVLHGVFQLSPRTPGGRVVVLGTAFMAVLLICMYTSAYAAFITTHNLKAQIKSMNDLTNLPVGIWEVRRWEGAWRATVISHIRGSMCGVATG